ncbi:MAG: LVIVD repeat-containing protein [Mycobacteriales bacterium]
MRSAPRTTALLAATALSLLAFASPSFAADAYPPTPDVPCDAGSLPETTQGRVPLAEVTSGRAAKGYTCNARELGHFGQTGGFRVESYVDKAGHVCAYYDTTLLFPKDSLKQGVEGTGTYVMDMSDPAHPKHVKTLSTPAMQSPHESLRLNQKRGLLVATLSYPTFNPGFVDVYDVTANCLDPQLKSSTPLGVLGHESGFSPDGNTYYAGSLYGRTLAAVDLTNPVVPSILWFTTAYSPHGMSLSDDGKTMYMAEASQQAGAYDGLTVLDVSQVQNRTLNPSVPVISKTTWPNVGTPQTTEPFTVNGHPYLMETDEYGSGSKVGAGRIIDIADIKKPVVISNMRLQVNQEKNQADPEQAKDPGASEDFQGYEGHYCTIPTRVNPTIVACSFIVSGFRLFDITDVTKPQEIAYFNGKVLPDSNPLHQGAFAMAAPAFSPKNPNEYWYSDENLGFYAVRTTAAAKRVTAAPATKPVAKPPTRSGSTTPTPAPGTLPTTGLPVLLPVLALVSLGGFAAVRRRGAAAS